MPVVDGRRPVSRLAREGLHSGALPCALANSVLWRARRSRFGVCARGWPPRQPTQSSRSSMAMKRALGFYVAGAPKFRGAPSASARAVRIEARFAIRFISNSGNSVQRTVKWGERPLAAKRWSTQRVMWSTPSVSHGRQPPLTGEYRLSETAASRWLHALVGPSVPHLNHAPCAESPYVRGSPALQHTESTSSAGLGGDSGDTRRASPHT